MAGPRAAQLGSTSQAVPWGARLAGGLLLAVGVLNVAFGVVSLASTLVRLAPGAAGGLVVAGALTAVAGWFVWRGSRRATLFALAVFAWLLVVQTVDVITHDGSVPVSGGIVGRYAVLVLLIAVLGLAALQLRSSAGERPPN